MPHAIPPDARAVITVFSLSDHLLEPRRGKEPVDLHLLTWGETAQGDRRVVGPDNHLVLRSGIFDRVASGQKSVEDRQRFAAIAVGGNRLQIGNRVRNRVFGEDGLNFIHLDRNAKLLDLAARRSLQKWPGAYAALQEEVSRRRGRFAPRQQDSPEPCTRPPAKAQQPSTERHKTFCARGNLRLAKGTISSPVAIHTDFTAWMAGDCRDPASPLPRFCF